MDLPVWKKPSEASRSAHPKCISSTSAWSAAGIPEYGEAFESFIHHELRGFADCTKGGEPHYRRSRSGWKVDFILNDSIAVKVKSKITIGKIHRRPSPPQMRRKLWSAASVFTPEVIVELPMKVSRLCPVTFFWRPSGPAIFRAELSRG